MGMKSLQLERDRFLGFAFAASDILLELDDDGSITFAAGSTQALLGQGESALLGCPLESLVIERDAELIRQAIAQVKHASRVGPYRIQLRERLITTELRALRQAPGLPIQVVIARMPSRASLPAKRYDAVSGLLDSASFSLLADRQLEDCRAAGTGRALTMIRLDGLDGAAQLADMGQLLGSIGGLLRSHSIDGDSAGFLGDGMFGVVHEPRVTELIERGLEQTVSEQVHGAEVAVTLRTMSMGEPSLTMGEASQALAHVLKCFAGQLQSKSQEGSLAGALNEHLRLTMDRISGFRETVRNLRFELAYQPVVDLETREVSHLEALSRFAHGEVTSEVVQFAENVGLTLDFDICVVRKVIERLSSLPPNQRRPRVAINMSAKSLEQDSFLAELKSMLVSAGRLSRDLIFEITESTEILDLQRAGRVVEDLRKGGNKISLDDFGAGASAFHYLRAIEVDQVKLDGGYIQNLLDSERDASIVVAMAELCRSLKVQTVAEMIETEAQLEAVRRIGIDLGQGYLLGRPGPQLFIERRVAKPGASPPATGCRRAPAKAG